jgi:sulfite reductase (NADPH) hemoprotein beta-component
LEPVEAIEDGMDPFSPPQPPPEKLSEAERFKQASNYLRGAISPSLADPLTASVPERETQLLKFHGTYQQDDRDLRLERAAQKLEPAFSFMLRVRASGGILTPPQWLALDQLARHRGDGTLRLTTRQSLELHGILKWKLRETIHRLNETGLTSLATCGDVNRNVMCAAGPVPSDIHRELLQWSERLAQRFLPQTTAYRELWIGEKEAAGTQDQEPLYGPTYLPRKFKIGIAVPPSNDVDVFTHDLGLVAIVEDGRLIGFNVLVGGGMGTTHGEPATYPRLASGIGFCRPDALLLVAETVIAIQRDFGDRTNRKHARLKYTIADRGLDWFRGEMHRRLGWELETLRPYQFDDRGDRYGWNQRTDGLWRLTLFLENGRICDLPQYPLMTGLRAIAEAHQGHFQLTPNQNLIVDNVAEQQRPLIEQMVAEHHLSTGVDKSPVRQNAMACVALSMCGLAMAEAERYMPQFLERLERLLHEVGLAEDQIVVRVTGCPNGCARSFVAEIGLVGKALGRYNLYLGGDFMGQRLNRLHRENVDESEIFETLDSVLRRYSQERQPGERFGDFLIRAGIVA